MKALSLRCVTQNGKNPVADPAPPPHSPQLFLDQTEAQRAEKNFFGPVISRFASGTENVSTVTGKEEMCEAQPRAKMFITMSLLSN